MGRAIPLPMLRKSFPLSLRRVAAPVQNGQPLDLNPAREAAEPGRRTPARDAEGTVPRRNPASRSPAAR